MRTARHQHGGVEDERQDAAADERRQQTRAQHGAVAPLERDRAGQPEHDAAERIEHRRHRPEAERREEGERGPRPLRASAREARREREHEREGECDERVAARVRRVLGEHGRRRGRGGGQEPGRAAVEGAAREVGGGDEQDAGDERGEADRPRRVAEDGGREVHEQCVEEVVVGGRVRAQADVERLRGVVDVGARLVVAHRLEEEVEPEQQASERDRAQRAELHARLGGDGCAEPPQGERRRRDRGRQRRQPFLQAAATQVGSARRHQQERGGEAETGRHRAEPLRPEVGVSVRREGIEARLDARVRHEGDDERGRGEQEQDGDRRPDGGGGESRGARAGGVALGGACRSEGHRVMAGRP